MRDSTMNSDKEAKEFSPTALMRTQNVAWRKEKSAGLTVLKLGVLGPYALLDQLQTWLVVSASPCGACISHDDTLSFQYGTCLTRADLIIVVAAVIIGLFGEVVVVG